MPSSGGQINVSPVVAVVAVAAAAALRGLKAVHSQLHS